HASVIGCGASSVGASVSSGHDRYMPSSRSPRSFFAPHPFALAVCAHSADLLRTTRTQTKSPGGLPAGRAGSRPLHHPPGGRPSFLHLGGERAHLGVCP